MFMMRSFTVKMVILAGINLLLKIHYLRSFSGKNIANHTVKEIAEQHPQLAHTTLDKYKEFLPD